MSAKTITIVTCDYEPCGAVYEYHGRGSIGAARQEAEARGWNVRGVWDLCPKHHDVSEVHRTASYADDSRS